MICNRMSGLRNKLSRLRHHKPSLICIGSSSTTLFKTMGGAYTNKQYKNMLRLSIKKIYFIINLYYIPTLNLQIFLKILPILETYINLYKMCLLFIPLITFSLADNIYAQSKVDCNTAPSNDLVSACSAIAKQRKLAEKTENPQVLRFNIYLKFLLIF